MILLIFNNNMNHYSYENLLSCKDFSKKETVIIGYLLSFILPDNKDLYTTFIKEYLNEYDKNDDFFYLKLHLSRIIEGTEQTKVYCLYTIFEQIDFLDRKNYKFIMKMLNKVYLLE